MSDYLTEEEFSERYNVARRTAARWRVTGEGPPFVRVGPRRIAYRLADCEQWAATRTHEHRAAEQAKRSTL
jgi:predicted DNA-binding transcriptional regulator AlpA